jgi:hypothetical protein
MSKFLVFTALAITLTVSAAIAQTAPPPAPAPQAAPQAAARPSPSRYGGLSGAWLMPDGDFSDIAKDGWAIILDGYQFMDPSKKVAIGTELGYYDFGEKNGVDVSNFPIDLVLKIFPKGDRAKVRPFLQGGIGFNYTKVETYRASASDYYFGTQAGVGFTIHGKGPAAFKISGTYHWIFASGVDPEFWSLRGGILIPMGR